MVSGSTQSGICVCLLVGELDASFLRNLLPTMLASRVKLCVARKRTYIVID